MKTTADMVKGANSQTIAERMIAWFGPLDAPGRLQHYLDRCSCCDGGINADRPALDGPLGRTIIHHAAYILAERKREAVAEMDARAEREAAEE